MRFIVQVSSIGDVITNSSSEIFSVADDDHTLDEICDIVEMYMEIDNETDWGVSKMEIDREKLLLIMPFLTDSDLKRLDKIFRYTNDIGPTGTYYLIDVDNNSKNTIDMIKNVMGGVRTD